jgi:hypothetical protein
VLSSDNYKSRSSVIGALEGLQRLGGARQHKQAPLGMTIPTLTSANGKYGNDRRYV